MLTAGLLIAMALGLSTATAMGTKATHAGAQDKPNRYIGAKKCKNCHSSEASGNQFGIWSDSKHSKSFESLATDQAMEYAKAREVEKPQESEDCVKCHVTGFGLPEKTFQRGFDSEAGIQCETCHGPGENHMKARFVAAASGQAEVAYVVVDDAEIIKQPKVDTCLACHNEESPAYKPFCFHEYRAKMRHLNPRKPRTDEEKAALDTCDCKEDCVCVKEGRCTK